MQGKTLEHLTQGTGQRETKTIWSNEAQGKMIQAESHTGGKKHNGMKWGFKTRGQRLLQNKTGTDNTNNYQHNLQDATHVPDNRTLCMGEKYLQNYRCKYKVSWVCVLYLWTFQFEICNPVIWPWDNGHHSAGISGYGASEDYALYMNLSVSGCICLRHKGYLQV